MAAGGAVSTETENVRCSLCGSSHLTTDDVTGLIVCDSCGHVKKQQQSIGGGSLTMALLKRRSQAVQWIVGERLLACESCGAERTIPATQLSQRCPFCDSKHVIERDVLGSFQQPDGIITFDISQKEAEDAIQGQLEGVTERIKGWFGSNKIKQMTMQGVYLPFWVFDCTVDVRRTVVKRSSDSSRIRTQVPVQTTTVTQDMKNNVPIAAVTSPSRLLTKKLGNYNWREIVQYEPMLLAEHAAQIYSMDFDEASLEARSVVGRFMRARQQNMVFGSNTEINVFVEFKQMNFQLVLLPVWVATLTEEDDDIRSALVNGQTGKVVLGKARKPER
jgi:DNA-directed RNA polymerase subunit RPC12/RpoP